MRKMLVSFVLATFTIMGVTASKLNASNCHNKVAATAVTAEQKATTDTVVAQSFIQQAVSDVQCPAALIMTNNGEVNVRQQPNTKARKIGSIYSDVLYAVVEEQNGWYKVKYNDYDGTTVYGWVSGTVTHKTENKPITADMQNSLYGYIEPNCDQYGNCDDAFCVTRVYIRPDGVCVAWLLQADYGCLYLGRYVNNVCCLKYSVDCMISQYNEWESLSDYMISLVEQGNEATGLWIGKEESQWDDQGEVTLLTYGSNYAIKLKEKEPFYETGLDLSLFDNDELLKYFFSDKIKNNEAYPFYISSALLSGKYVTNH